MERFWGKYPGLEARLVEIFEARALYAAGREALEARDAKGAMSHFEAAFRHGDILPRPGEAGAAFDLAGVEPIINHGAQVKWQYAGVEYQATSNAVINGRRIFLPIIVRGAG